MIFRAFALIVLCLSFLGLVAGCASSPSSKGGSGGYYKDDGPGANIPKNLHAIPNATPRIERHAPANMRPYTVLGQSYTPLTNDQPFRQTGHASWYGKKFHGRKTANGETYDMYAMTAAHPTLPLPSYAKVTRPQSGQSVIVRINDRGPFHRSRIIDLSYVAAAKLGLIGPGSGTVIVEAITHDDIRNGRYLTDSNQKNTTGSVEAIPVENAPEPRLTTVDSRQTIPPPIPLSPIAGNGLPRIYLQFGAFRNAQSATELANHINQEVGQLDYHDAHIEPANELFRVQMGPYESRAEALTAAQLIETETGLKPSLAVR
ncbi:septal ring lytic transglycosylase RlpA family protein [uncultured Paenalcaligenes sp.]|uniref:septal ring lytic transglycosylase RlpA family protein n=1 Tax=uncultured Paenalcaligenes sp. TaxID=1588925 RepID=UPI002613E9CB|nr:septal ring lytic transglycosylase RlpA family protein [uncultured Paenalcaligenes sp.]